MRFSAIAMIFLSGCAARAARQDVQGSKLRDVEGALLVVREKADALAEKYASGKEAPENIATTVVFETSIEIDTAADFAANYLYAQIGPSQEARRTAMNYKASNVKEIERDIWRRAVSVVVRIRSNETGSKNDN